MNYARQGPNVQSPFFTTPNFPSVIDGNRDFSTTQMATHPANKITIGKHIFVVDSRQRDCKLYPSPSRFRIDIGDVYKNISSIELKGVILPKSSYNIHSSNKYIDFAIGDSVTSIGIDETGSGYTAPPTVTISSPPVGVTATATAVLGVNGSIANIIIGVAGSGYSPSNPPIVTIESPPVSGFGIVATASTVVGTHYTTALREGNYVMGGNPTPPATLTSDLLLEIQNAMNFAVNGAPYDVTSVSPFVARVVNQYPELGATPGTPEAADTNACLFNRFQITNINSDPWELLWCSGPNSTRNMRRVLGYPWVNSTNPTVTPPVVAAGGVLVPGGTTLRGNFDYDLIDDPNYVILSFWAVADDGFERISSKSVGGLNRAFATLVYDANPPESLMDLSNDTTTGSIETIGGDRYLVGDLGKGSFWRSTGNVKPLKGFDFDKKYLEFSPPIGKLSYLNINFTKYGQKPGGVPEFYDFQGRDCLLIFEFTSGDVKGLVDA